MVTEKPKQPEKIIPLPVVKQEEKEKTEESLDDDDIEAGGIETDIEQDLMYADNPIVYLKSIIDFLKSNKF